MGGSPRFQGRSFQTAPTGTLTSQIHSLREFRSGGGVDGVSADSDDAPEAAQPLDGLRSSIFDLEVQRVSIHIHFGSGDDAAPKGRQELPEADDGNRLRGRV